MRKLFNDNWEFKKVTAQSEDKTWSRIDIPHDWHIYDVFNLYEDGEGWYRKTFDCEMSGDRIFIRFDGVYMDTTVLINDKVAGEWKYGYSTFEIEITALVHNGSNEIKVRSIFKNPNSRWYSGAGIYRNVWFITKPCSHIVSDGIYISSENTDGKMWNVHISIETDIADSDVKKDIYTAYGIYDAEGNRVCEGRDGCIQVADPILWDIKNPYLYTLCAGLYIDGKLIDNEKVRFGFRKIDFTSDSGFYLNGRHVKLKGVCMHHDLGCLGAAINKAAIRRQVKILKSMGVNAIRTAHNMPAPEFMDIADEEGILVDSEAFDMWERSKTEYDYARFFKDWYKKDVASWIRRDRNHPSVIMWSIGNEIYDTHADKRGLEVTRMLMEEVYRHDSMHNAYVTMGSNYMPWENAAKCADVLKLAGYNYAEAYYDEHHRLHPDWKIYGSETSSVVQSRGIYHFPASVGILSEDDLQCSSLMNSTTSWGTQNLEKCIRDDMDNTYSAGMFVWSGFDYIGEPTPYHTKNSYFGQIDTAGFPKDSYYIYQSCWTDYRENPMIHIFPYWDFNEGQLIDVMVCTNAPEMELFFNGVSKGITYIDTKHKKELVKKYVIPYEKGELRAVAYDDCGNIIAEDIKRSFGDAESIVLKPDKTSLKADGEDLLFVEISVCDKDGNPVENANNRINISVTGAGRLVGLDNGDSTDMDSYKGTSKRLFSGKLLAVIASKTMGGKIHVRADSPGLKGAFAMCFAEDACVAEGISAIEYNMTDKTVAENEIPVRKLEICSHVQKFDKNVTEADIEVNIRPENAVYKDVMFSVTDDNGVESNIAAVTACGTKAHIKALGDGRFRLRCASFNGTGHYDIISQKEYEVSGLGEVFLNPYGFISGSLYSKSKGTITNGNEKGVATPRDHVSYIYYDNLDFGNIGSDEIEIPIFELENTKLEFEIWEGMPYEDKSEKLLDAVYDKPSVWNTYQSEKFTLNKILKGITGIGFVFKRKAHIKGFSFTEPDVTGKKIYTKDCGNIYGDTFKISDYAVENIGNNVSFVYNNFNFGENGAERIVICGRTPLKNNTIHIRFKKGENIVNKIIEFENAEEYTEREYSLSDISGRYDEVLFIFLPGSNFDFKWFEFL